jgi:hypothetical protein
MHRTIKANVRFSRVLLAIGTVTLLAGRALAVDVSGVYFTDIKNNVLSPPDIFCTLTFAQSGMALSVTGTCDIIGAMSASGTVDSGTGAFTISGNAAVLCTAAGSLTASGTGDGSTITGTAGCAFLSTEPFHGSKCGNGLPDPGEQCDHGPTTGTAGDCCTTACQFATGSPCTSDGNVCTDDVCDAGGACTHPRNTAPCDDGNVCTTGDTCAGGVCVGGPPAPAGTTCDADSSGCTFDECNATGQCVPTGGTLTCDPCSTCDPFSGCVGLIQGACAVPSVPSSILLVKTQSPDTKDRATWSWGKGSATTVGDFGNPPVSTNYLFCAYAWNDDVGYYKSIAVADLPAGAAWIPKSTGFAYKSDIAKVLLRAGEAGKAKIKFKGKGPSLGAPVTFVGYHEALYAELRADNGNCWSGWFTDPPKKLTPVEIKGIDGH